jgi:predicted phosphodiesterase
MKRIIIGDPHGRWKYIEKIYNKEQPDEVIILGDYFDSFDIDAYAQRECYDNIVNLRKEHLDKKKGRFIMLIGNHDFHYMDEKFGRCSGWNPLTCSQAGYPLCRDWNNDRLKMIFVDEVNYTIYSHAGISQNWFDYWIKSKSLGDINTIETKAFCFTFKEGGDYFGSSIWNSPLWIRPEGLKKCPYKDNEGIIWNQIFGHTEPDTPIYWKQEFEDYTAEFYGIDCIYKHYLIEYLTDNGKLIERKLGNVID